MVAGMEKYYQIARCFRDEDFRADRQPEFTQLDIEMSFVDQEDILAVAEKILVKVWKEVLDYQISLPIPRMTYLDAMARYGSDKPDLRFDLELVDCTSFFKETTFRVFQAPYVGAVVMPGGADSPRRELDAWQDWAKARGAKGLAYILVATDGALGGPVAKNLTENEAANIAAHVGAKPGDAIFFAAGERTASLNLLGAVRLEIGKRCNLIDNNRWEFVWIVDAPMFEPTDNGGWTAVHHPFTGPKPEYAETFAKDPASALAYAYDIVLNGTELGGGSIRIHNRSMQKDVFTVIGLSDEEAASKFGFLLEAFNYGPPPHGGIALGLDRLCALLSHSDSIREVIAIAISYAIIRVGRFIDEAKVSLKAVTEETMPLIEEVHTTVTLVNGPLQSFNRITKNVEDISEKLTSATTGLIDKSGPALKVAGALVTAAQMGKSRKKKKKKAE
jgi:aspartyl-tRNA synthetase